ncbi:MAG: LysR family transcriptional regulator [Oceanospirillaceae bacterium]|nr:LysR family transcriptional regulator [Oceanospirillaceae bacterium]
MSLNHFDLNLLRVFEALVSEAHVTRAAEKLFLSQSATSHALNRLREQLGDPVLVRSGNGLQPTLRAAAMLTEVREILKRLEHTLTPPEAFDAANSTRTFTLAVTDYFEALIFPRLMWQLAQEAPGIRIDLQMIGPQASLQDLEDGTVDMVVGLDGSASIAAHLIRLPWVKEKPVCLVGENMADIPQRLTLKKYLSLPHVLMLDQTDSTTTTVDRWLAAQKLRRQHSAQMINYLAAARLVSQRDAVVTLPHKMAELFSEWLPVRIVAAPAELPDWEMTMVLHPLQQQDSGVQWLLKQIRTHAAEIG